VGRVCLILVALALLGLPAAVAANPPTAPWAQAQIVTVTASGLLGGDAADFRPDDPLTAGDLADLAAGLTGRPAATPVDPAASVTIAGLNAQLVRALGLSDAARLFMAGARAAGLAPPARFGNEAVARLLGLRFNHPASQDGLELRPQDVATRAEAAYSAARILRFGGWEIPSVRDEAQTFAPDAVSGWQLTVLQTAVGLIGYPYVWAGTSESPQAPLGSPVPGGFDCSGFVWRVYKLGSATAGTSLAGTLRGRTTYAMSGEVPKSERIPLAQLEAGDVLFFGAHGPRSKPSEVDHAGIYLGAGWFIHSSEQGVSLSPLGSDWYAKRFAWARRPLAEAGLI
jgi:cell wall-associated NlpC family hydrolase